METKFRAWDKENKKMGYFDLSDGSVSEVHRELEFEGFNTFFPEGGDGYFQFIYNQENANQALMQYTGVKDKNGVEIYEDDIVKYGKEGSTAEISFKHGAFWIGHALMATIDFKQHPIEVIGHIYEEDKSYKLD